MYIFGSYRQIKTGVSLFWTVLCTRVRCTLWMVVCSAMIARITVGDIWWDCKTNRPPGASSDACEKPNKANYTVTDIDDQVKPCIGLGAPEPYFRTQPMWSRYPNVTDRQTDRRHTVDMLCQLCGRCRGSTATSFQFIFVTDSQPHPTVYRRWPTFSGRRCSLLGQSAWSCHFRTFRSCLSVSAQNPPV